MPPDSLPPEATRDDTRAFASTLSAALAAGAGALLDADPAEEAARLRALHAAQRLHQADQAQPQSLLSLFKTP
jgi:hypothetical protein